MKNGSILALYKLQFWNRKPVFLLGCLLITIGVFHAQKLVLKSILIPTRLKLLVMVQPIQNSNDKGTDTTW